MGDSKKDNQAPRGLDKQFFLICCTVGLSVLGVVTFLSSGQVAVVVAMNAPLLALIGREALTTNSITMKRRYWIKNRNTGK